MRLACGHKLQRRIRVLPGASPALGMGELCRSAGQVIAIGRRCFFALFFCNVKSVAAMFRESAVGALSKSIQSAFEKGIYNVTIIDSLQRQARAVAGPATLVGLVLGAASASAAPLPGGAGSLVETYQDWIVACQAQNNTTQCAMRQVQSNKDTGQNVLTIEVANTADGKLQAALLMPFGLALAQGVAVRIDDTPAGSPAAFSTCIPQGCLASISFDAGQVAKLKTGTNLNVSATALAPPQPVALKVSLKGFSAALARVGELTK